MISKQMIDWGESGCSIREIAAYGERRAAEIGPENVYNFAIGNPSIDPPDCVHAAVERLLRTVPPTQLHAYAPAPGMASVREKVAAYLTRTFGEAYRAQDIYMTDGASSALAILTRALMGPGDEAIVFAPYFPEYAVYAEAAGGSVRVVPCRADTFALDLEALAAAVTEKTALLILNSPNNPSGVVVSRPELEALAALLREKQAQYGHPIYIIADEPYRELVYDNAEVPYIPGIYRDTVICYSYSKSLSMPGERIGYVARRKKELIAELNEKREKLIGSLDSETPAVPDDALHRHYRCFDELPIAFTDIEMVLDDSKNAVDWIFRYANPALAKLEKVPLNELIGHSFRSVFPNMDSKWLKSYERSALYGETLELIDHSPEIDTYLKIICFPTQPGHCGCLLFDIAEMQFAEDSGDSHNAKLRYFAKMLEKLV